MADPTDAKRQKNISQPPRGTRDFYPEEMRKRRYIEDSWRRAAVRHGFDEVDGPRFEHLDLYTVKSGEGIVSELFSFTREGGDTRFALRPEFTPTVARMVAARANALPKPIKWFSVGPYFRAERPQRGRLREFLQWNVDIFGDDSPRADAELIACCVEMLKSVGLGPKDVKIRVSNRRAVAVMLRNFAEVPEDRMEEVFLLVDKQSKMSDADFKDAAKGIDVDADLLLSVMGGNPDTQLMVEGAFTGSGLPDCLHDLGLRIGEWWIPDPSIVRGLAYYTGTVFEVHEAGGKERAIAGGGRYDNLIELFGGPPAPAVGFAMGDVVLSLVLEDKGLMPSDNELRARTGQQVDVFVVPEDGDAADAQLLPAVAQLRRAGLHARHSYKSTRNVGKLVKEAKSVGSAFALFVDGPDTARLENLATGESSTLVLADVARAVLRARAASECPE